MSRNAARKIGRSPNADHVLVQRDSTGTVQTSQDYSESADPGTTGTGTVTPLTHTVTNPNLVAFTTVSATIAGGGTGTTLNILRDGAVIASTGTGIGSTTTTGTHTTPLNAPQYQVQVDAAGATPTAVTLNVSREDRWV